MTFFLRITEEGIPDGYEFCKSLRKFLKFATSELKVSFGILP